MGIDNENLELILRKQISSFFKYNRRVMVSCSGGPDSTVLLNLCWQVAKQDTKISLAIFHVNFGLRGADSDEDERFLQLKAKKLRIGFFSHRPQELANGQRSGESIQEWARRVRLQLLRPYLTGWPCVALGHHQDDMVENIVFRLTRGVTGDHLQGMRTYLKPYWRPMLGVNREFVRNYCQRYNLDFRLDHTNMMDEYSRNRIRHNVLPQLDLIHKDCRNHLIAFAKQTEEIYEHLFCLYQPQIKSLQSKGLSSSFLLNLPENVAILILRHASRRNDCRHVGYKVLDRFLAQLHADDGKVSVNLPGGRCLVRKDGMIIIEDITPKPRKQSRPRRMIE